MSPIHQSWKKMAAGMRSTYAGGKNVCRDFTDGTKICMSEKGWSVFYATIRKMGASDTKPRPKTVTQEAKEIEIKEWFLESRLESPDIEGMPKWVPFAESILKSPKYSKKVKSFWQDKLDQYRKKKGGKC